jgi:hypothetical protein
MNFLEPNVVILKMISIHKTKTVHLAVVSFLDALPARSMMMELLAVQFVLRIINFLVQLVVILIVINILLIQEAVLLVQQSFQDVPHVLSIMGKHNVRNVGHLVMKFLEQHAVTRRLLCSLMGMIRASPVLSFIPIVTLVSLLLSHRVASVKKDILQMLMGNVSSLETALRDAQHAKVIHVLVVKLDLPCMAPSAVIPITTILILMVNVYSVQLFKLDVLPAPTILKPPQLHAVNATQGQCTTFQAPNAAIVRVMNSPTIAEVVGVVPLSSQIA